MTSRPPADVAMRIKAAIYDAADKARYMTMSRTESGQFMDDLVKQKEIGGVLESFISKPKIRHYIKDGVLNRYTKDKANEALAVDVDDIIYKIFGFSATESGNKSGVTLFRSNNFSDDGKYIVVVSGTFMKWETALRKALLFVAGSPISKSTNSINILLVLFAQGKIITPSDIDLLKKGLALCRAEVHIV